jgi:hypothetical protein
MQTHGKGRLSFLQPEKIPSLPSIAISPEDGDSFSETLASTDEVYTASNPKITLSTGK